VPRKRLTLISALVLIALWTGCSGCGPNHAIKQEKNGYLVRVFYATDRNPLSIEGGIQQYGSDSSEELSFGSCDVHIPNDHQKGMMEQPAWYVFRPDQSKYLSVTRVSPPQPREVFFGELSDFVKNSSKHEVLVFIHGYDVSFTDAARRTAQLAYDLDFAGVPILYSWPSKARLIRGYTADEATIQYTKFHLRDFLQDLAEQSHADVVHIIAHSMGNRALIESLSTIASHEQRPSTVRPRFRQIVLAAPDVDVRVFKELVKVFPSTAEHTTLYANSNDKALFLSSKLHASASQGKDIRTFKNVDVIDASAIHNDFLEHSNFAQNRVLLQDIATVINDGKPANERLGLKPKEGYFYIVPGR
jgi:esterase/lipase superfamily enzyme